MLRLLLLLIIAGRAQAAPSEKRAAVEAMLARGPVTVTLDTRRAGVVVPALHDTDARMTLVLERGRAQLDDVIVRESLTEHGVTTLVVVPWSAVYAAVAADGAATSWERDRPTDLVDDELRTVASWPGVGPKRAQLEAMLATRAVKVYVDATRRGVVVPAKYAKDRDLVLFVGYVMTPPIPDLATSDFGITATLSFAGKPFPVRLPWASIYAAAMAGYARGVEWIADTPDAFVPDAGCYAGGSDLETRRGCEKACQHGSLAGCNNLAKLLVQGGGGPPDPARGRALFEKACVKVRTACENAGEVSRSALGVPRDDKRAAKYFTLGCDHDDAVACEQVAYFTEHGIGVAKDAARARSLYARSCKLGDAHACTNLGLDYAHAGDHVRARALYTQACDGEDGKGCFELGWSYDSENPTLALTLYRRGCELGSIAACNNVAARDKAGAARAIEMACKLPAPDPENEPDLVNVYAKLCPR